MACKKIVIKKVHTMHATKIAIIGTGMVGSTTAFACMMRNIAAEILLVDINESACKGEALDLSDALSFSATAQVTQATYKQAAQADIIIIAAGAAQKPNQPRTDLLAINKKIIRSIVEALGTINPQAIIIMVTNPVDTITWYAQQIIKLPKNQIMGSSTMLDSQRLRNLIAQKIHIAEESIHLSIIGEHGESQVALLSTATIAGVPLEKYIPISELKKLAQEAMQKVYEIIDLKKSTTFGVASCVAAMCEDIIFDTNRVMPVSCYIKKHDVCMGMPAIIGASGIRDIIVPPLNQEEEANLEKSAKSLLNNIQELKNI